MKISPLVCWTLGLSLTVTLVSALPAMAGSSPEDLALVKAPEVQIKYQNTEKEKLITKHILESKNNLTVTLTGLINDLIYSNGVFENTVYPQSYDLIRNSLAAVSEQSEKLKNEIIALKAYYNQKYSIDDLNNGHVDLITGDIYRLQFLLTERRAAKVD